MWLRLVMLCALFGSLAVERAAAQAPAQTGYPSGLPEHSVELSSSEATKLRALEADLAVLADLSGGRIVDGVLALTFGAAFITLGTVFDDALARTLFTITGAVATTRGLIEILVLPDAGDSSRRFNQYPMRAHEQVEARIAFGETELARLARRTRAARLSDGIVTMTAGVIYVPSYLLARRAQEPGYRFGTDPLDWITVGAGGVSFAAGLVAVVQKSDAEKRVRAYQRLTGELAAGGGARRVRMALAPAPRGLALFAYTTF